MKTNRMSIKIISYILIQAFICLDLFAAGAAANPQDTATLAPAMAINKVDLQGMFFQNLNDTEDDLDEDLAVLDTSVKEETGKMSKGSIKSSGIVSQNDTPSTHGLSKNTIISGNEDSQPPPEPPINSPASIIDSNYLPPNNVFSDDDHEKLNQEIGMMTIAKSGLPIVDFTNKEIKGQFPTARELGLPKETIKLFRKLREIASEYYDQKFWPGVKTFAVGLSEDEDAIMQIDPDDNTVVGVITHAIPDLIRLMEEAPSLFEEFAAAIIVHEGGISGHGMKWPIQPEDLDWTNMSIKEIMNIIYDATVNRSWPKFIYERGIPPFSSWLISLSVIWRSLKLAGFNPMEANPWGIIWKESQANLGMVHEKGVRSVALWIWYSRCFSPPAGEMIDIEQELSESFAFLEMQNITYGEILDEVKKIQLDYELEKKSRSNIPPGTIFASIGLALLTFFVSFPVSASAGSFQIQGAGVDWIVMATVISSIAAISWMWNKLPWGKSTKKRTVQLVNQAVKQHKKDAQKVNLIKLQKFYMNASFKERSVIINTIRERVLSNPGKIDAGIFEPFFKNILEFGPKNVFQNLQSSVSEKMKIKSSDRLMMPVACMNPSVEDALKIYNKRSLPQDRIKVKAVSFELSQLVVNLTVSNTLHKRDVFVESLLKNAALAKYINKKQADQLYTVIVTELPYSFVSEDEVVSKILEKELKKLRGRINATQAASDIAPHLAVSLSSLENTVKAEGFLQAMLSVSKALQESSLSDDQLRGFFAAISEKLINGLAMRVAFSDSYAVIKSEIEKLGLGIDADEAAATFMPVMARASFLRQTGADYNDLAGEAVYQRFYNAVEDETAGLKFSVVSALEDFAGSGMGTGRLVEYLKRYLRAEGTNISMPLKQKIIGVVENLSEDGFKGTVSEGDELSGIFAEAGPPAAKSYVISSGSPVFKVSVADIKIGNQLSQLTLTKSEMVESAI